VTSSEVFAWKTDALPTPDDVAAARPELARAAARRETVCWTGGIRWEFTVYDYRSTREAYVRKYLSRLVDMVGVEEAAVIHEEVVRRVGEHGSIRQWTAALLKVSLERGHDIGPILTA
jgi:hypothetical protein